MYKPSSNRTSKVSPVHVWVVVTSLGLGIVTALTAAPLAQAFGYTGLSATIYAVFSFVCHQMPERSLHLYGNKFAVCSRCTGIYAGIALVALTYPLTRSLKQTVTPSLIWLFLAAAPLAIDWSLGYFSIWQNNHASRFGTGFLLGGAAILYILPGLIDLSLRIRRRENA